MFSLGACDALPVQGGRREPGAGTSAQRRRGEERRRAPAAGARDREAAGRTA